MSLSDSSLIKTKTFNIPFQLFCDAIFEKNGREKIFGPSHSGKLRGLRSYRMNQNIELFDGNQVTMTLSN